MSYDPRVYKTSGGDQLTVTTGGVLAINSGVVTVGGATFISSGGGFALGSFTTGDVTFPGRVTATSGFVGTTGNFSSGLAVGQHLTVTSGVSATTGNFSSSVAIGANLTITSGLNATTGDFTGAVGVGAAFTMSSAMIRPFEQPATGVANPYTITAYGITRVWSSASDSTAGRRFNLGAPVAGVEKWLVCTKSTATAPAIVSSTGSTGLFDNANSIYIFSTGATNVQWIHLLGENSTNWLTLSRSTDITVSST